MLNTFIKSMFMLIIAERQQMTRAQMEAVIHEVYPKWNLKDMDDGKVMAIYFRIKERMTKK